MKEKRHEYVLRNRGNCLVWRRKRTNQIASRIIIYYQKIVLLRGDNRMSKKKGAKGMPSSGPGKHDPSKPQKTKSEGQVFDRAKGGIKNERPRKSRI
jgi:hypothetical protein